MKERNYITSKLKSDFSNCGGYTTQNRVLFFLNSGNFASTTLTHSALRKYGFDNVFPPKRSKIICYNCYLSSCSQTFYPLEAVPAIAFRNLKGDSELRMIFAFDDGTVIA